VIAALLLALAGLMGAAGVALAAASAHVAPAAKLDVAGFMLLFHAAAVLATVGLGQQGLLARSAALATAGGLALGAVLFSGDLALRAFAATRLFPMAAPTGGVILIASWLALAAVAVVRMVRTA
jgi:uncharacterized membrane protein YgdD (TMEM256/DUF423 family)